jgi:2-polyprenyl-6-methoxyphenol hydroxylase-like FAD-dependent oxidoreductase
MKVVIIGGGVAGLSLGLLLNKQNIEVVINEKMTEFHTRGHAFLMHLDGWSILEELSEGKMFLYRVSKLGNLILIKAMENP